MPLITVNGTIRDIDGEIPTSGTVTFVLDGFMVDPDNEIIPAKSESCPIDDTSPLDGTFSIQLNSTMDCFPSTRSYSVGFVAVIDGHEVTQPLGSFQLATTPDTVDLGQLIISGFSGGSVTPTLQAPDVKLTLRETDQSLPAGLWRIRVNSDNLTIEKNTASAGDFSTFDVPFLIQSDLRINFPGAAQFSRIGLGSAADSVALLLLSGTGAIVKGADAATANQYIRLTNTSGDLVLGLESSVGNSIVFTGATAYSTVFGAAGAKSLHLGTNSLVRMTITSAGLIGVNATPSQQFEVFTSGNSIWAIKGTNSGGTSAGLGTNGGVYGTTGVGGVTSVGVYGEGTNGGIGGYFTSTAGAALETGTGPVIIGGDPGGTDLLRVNGGLTIHSAILLQTTTSLTDGFGSATGTLTNAPAAGNPTKWIELNDNGVTRRIPSW